MNSIWLSHLINVSAAELDRLDAQLINSFEAQLKEQNIEQNIRPYLKQFYIPFAAWLKQKQSLLNSTLIVGINGAQGSGKTTISQLTATILQQGFNLKTVILSIDDLYKTRQQREQMASDIHPLYKTRGVPGTHDTALGIDVLEKIKTLKPNETLRYPAFDKGNDEPLPISLWPKCQGPIDIIIFEGWCVGASAQTKNALRRGINSLETNEDADGIWRNAVNEHLKSDYKSLFDLLDCLVFIQIPSFDYVLKWRGLQEQKLANKHQHEQHLMTSASVLKRFVDHYERLTQFQLVDMPNKADLVIKLGEDHQIKALTIK
ncbi:MAG: hypothetical protein COB22_02495 [Cycloclasticus sp.]|nr:MAG: hypothetical protein COB22_02495 [Cycloclasticus sp.]